MGRTVTDAAILLGVLQSPFGEVVGHSLPNNYTQFLQRGALQGKRIGRDTRYSWAYLIRRPNATVPTVVDLTVVVYSGRSLQFTQDLMPSGDNFSLRP